MGNCMCVDVNLGPVVVSEEGRKISIVFTRSIVLEGQTSSQRTQYNCRMFKQKGNHVCVMIHRLRFGA